MDWLHLSSVIEGVVLYLLLCVLSILAGRGLLRLLRFRVSPEAELHLAAVLTLLFWVLSLGVLVGMRVPVKFAAPPLWGATLLLALHGLRGPWPSWRTYGPGLLACAIAPMVLMGRHFLGGLSDYLGSILPDGWSYMAYAEYIWRYPRHTEGGLAPLYQYAAHLNAARYISRSIISALRPLSRMGDAQSVAALYQAWTLFMLAHAVSLYLAATLRKRWVVVTGALLTVISGWLANMIWTYNFDNGLALVYMPALGGMIMLADLRRRRWWLVFGALLAAALYTYPELSPLIIGGGCLVGLPRIWAERAHWRYGLRGGVLAVVLAAVVVLPEGPSLLRFWRSQFNQVSTTPAGRTADGYFPGVIMEQQQPAALWGLGSEHGMTSGRTARNNLGWLLSGVAAAGLFALLRRRQWGLVITVLLLLAAALYWGKVRNYSYATYKMVLLNWWGLAIAAVSGAEWLLAVARPAWIRWPLGVGLVGILCTTWSESFHIENPDVARLYSKSSYQHVHAPDFRRVAEIKDIIGDEPVRLLVNEWFAHEWAVYYLRDAAVHLPMYRMLMGQPHVIPFMERSRSVEPDAVRYALTERNADDQGGAIAGWERVWSGGPYALWRITGRSWILLTGLDNPDGRDIIFGDSQVWLGQSEAKLHLLAGDDGIAQVGAGVLPGPSGVDGEPYRIRVSTDGGFHAEIEVEQKQYVVFAVPVVRGANTVTLTPLTKVPPPVTEKLEDRPLLLFLRDLSIWLTPGRLDGIEHLELFSIKNPNGFARRREKPFFWLGHGATEIRVRSSIQGTMAFSANVVVEPSLADGHMVHLRVTGDGGYQAEARLGEGVQTLEVPVKVGVNTVQLEVVEEGTGPDAGEEGGPPPRAGFERLRVWLRETT